MRQPLSDRCAQVRQRPNWIAARVFLPNVQLHSYRI